MQGRVFFFWFPSKLIQTYVAPHPSLLTQRICKFSEIISPKAPFQTLPSSFAFLTCEEEISSVPSLKASQPSSQNPVPSKLFLHQLFTLPPEVSQASQVALAINSLPASTWDTVQSLGREDPLKEMAAHSSILAWRTPWTGEPGRLQYMGLQSVRHD